MGQISRRTLFGVAAVVAVAIAGSAALVGCGGKGGGATSAADIAIGKADAKVTVIEYGSLSCHVCADWNKEVYPAFKAKYVDTGQVRYIFRAYQLSPQDTYTSAGDLIGRCAGQDKYLTLIDALFHSQAEALGGAPRDVLLRVAGSAGLSESQVRACLSDEKAITAQAARLQDGLAKEVSATPSFFINGKKYGGSLPLPEMDKAIAEAAAKAK